MNKEKFSNPPITEALLDIQIEPAITLSSEEIERIHASFVVTTQPSFFSI